jgi:hypothetical protein
LSNDKNNAEAQWGREKHRQQWRMGCVGIVCRDGEGIFSPATMAGEREEEE